MTRTAVVPGNHDGVHVGHRRLVAEARERAVARGLSVLGLFFDPHPAVVLAPARAPTPLTTPARRRELLRAAGCDEVVVDAFDRDYAAMSPERFVRDVLVGRLGAALVVVGPDFRFGAGRAGNVESLRAMAANAGLEVHVVAPLERDGVRISSTRVRDLLAEGKTMEAARALGRLHDVDATVERGDGRGRVLGYPTANLRPDSVMLPADGIYALLVRTPDGQLHRAVASLGERPTFDQKRTFEVHLFGRFGELYGQRLRVAFGPRLRAIARFDSADALVRAIAADVEAADRALDAIDPELVQWL
ncbi:MAG: riboflavin biosynthesis protein RibF [Myxococcota bacterium]|nr:riboflavin biosynthesis protein RibF [Myxococcota bacterium]MDW8363403.1 riboflavin biosynthesis protein RibF [Myxococcales bacterium]